jgi:hypothetical protein
LFFSPGLARLKAICRQAGGQQPDDEPRCEFAESNPLAGGGSRAGEGFRRKGRPEPGERRLLKQRVEGRGNRRSRLAQRLVTPAQTLVRRQLREQAVLRLFVELIVDQGDECASSTVI